MFNDMMKGLLGQDERVSCTWRGCDPYTTDAVVGIEGNGQSSNCGRTNKDGVDFVKASRVGFERYVALYHVPYENGGCAGCRFFLMCRGHCPGTGLNGDWRHRTEHCEVYLPLFEALEEELLAAGRVPISVDSRRPDLERKALACWKSGVSPSIASLLQDGQNAEAQAVPVALYARDSDGTVRSQPVRRTAQQ
jgi:uncharacterized protein